MINCKNPSHEHYGKLEPNPTFDLPKGYLEIGVAFASDTEIVIVGTPPDEEEDPECLLHDCDMMGCGQDHVLYRFKKESNNAT